MSSAYFTAVQKIYIAFYQRPADPAGLRYWAQRMEAAGGDQAAVIDAFANSAEATALYGAINSTTIGAVVDALYLALFNRTPDAAGKKFYVDAFNAGTITAGKIALAVLNGASGDDAVAVQNKVAVANEFTQQVDGRELNDAGFGTGTAFNVTYSGNADVVAARDFLKAVTSSPSTVLNDSQITEALKTKIADATDPIQSQSGGKTFTLTSGADQADTTGSSKNGGLITSDFKFTSGNELVTAVAGTLAAGDVLADGSTTDADVLNATITAAGATAVSVSNIETINLDVKTATGGLDMTSVTGAKTVSVNTNSGIAAQVTNIAPATAPVVVLKGSGVLTANVTSLAGTTAAGTAESLSFKFNGATIAGTNVPGLTLTATTAGTLETLNLESTGSTKNTVTLTAGAGVTAIGKSVVTGATDLELRSAASTFNGMELAGSGHTGVLTVNADFDGGAAVVGLNAEKYTGVDAYIVRDTAATPGATGFGLFNIASGVTVRLADDIAAASIITVAGASASTTDSVNLLLQNRATTATDVDVTGGLTINNVESIKITSTGAPTTGDTQSSLTLNADKIATLTLDGASDLAVTLGAGTVAATNTANISIDGGAATGKLAVVAGNIANFASGTRSVTIKGGTNDDALTGVSTVPVKNVFDLSAGGKDTVNIVLGDTNDSITAFTNGDKIALGAVAGGFVNGLNATEITAAEQATIEAAVDLAAAATAAAGAVTAYAANTAVLFSYQGNQYILMDDATFMAYDAGSDAIVQVTGLSGTTTFDAGTFLFAA